MTDAGGTIEHRSSHGRLGGSVTWRLDGARLTMTGMGRGHEDGFALRDIREVRLSLMASRFRKHHVCELQLADRSRLRIDDEYARFAIWKVASGESYRRFVVTLCTALAVEGTECRFRTGPRGSVYLAMVLVMAAAIHLIAQFLVVHVGLSETEGRWFFAFGCGLILLKSPYWRRVNRPAAFDPVAIPEALLPRETAPVRAAA